MTDILFLAHRVPYPPDRGDKIRSWHILKALCAQHRVHVVALCDAEEDLEHRKFLLQYAASVTFFMPDNVAYEAIFKTIFLGGSASVRACASKQLQQHVDKLLKEQDISTIYAFSGQMAQFVGKSLNGRRFIMDFVDMDSAKLAAQGTIAGVTPFLKLKRRIYHSEARRLLAFERETAKRADVSLFVSAAEAALFRETTDLGIDKVQVLENGIDLDYFRPDNSVENVTPPHVVFTGQMDYGPNVDAVCDFARDVWPLISAKLPTAEFIIVGRNPTERVLALCTVPGVKVTGTVPDTRRYLAQASVVVAPLKLARGVQNKVLEAMATGKAVAASSAAAEGIDARAGTELLVVDEPEAQAAAIVHLIQNSADAKRIGQAARARVEARYNWDAQLARLTEIINGP